MLRLGGLFKAVLAAGGCMSVLPKALAEVDVERLIIFGCVIIALAIGGAIGFWLTIEDDEENPSDPPAPPAV